MAIGAWQPKRLQAHDPRLVADVLMEVEGVCKGLQIGLHLHNGWKGSYLEDCQLRRIICALSRPDAFL